MYFKPKKQDVGIYFISVILQDVNKRGSKNTTYTLKVVVMKEDSTFES